MVCVFRVTEGKLSAQEKCQGHTWRFEMARGQWSEKAGCRQGARQSAASRCQADGVRAHGKVLMTWL